MEAPRSQCLKERLKNMVTESLMFKKDEAHAQVRDKHFFVPREEGCEYWAVHLAEEARVKAWKLHKEIHRTEETHKTLI